MKSILLWTTSHGNAYNAAYQHLHPAYLIKHSLNNFDPMQTDLGKSIVNSPIYQLQQTKSHLFTEQRAHTSPWLSPTHQGHLFTEQREYTSPWLSPTNQELPLHRTEDTHLSMVNSKARSLLRFTYHFVIQVTHFYTQENIKLAI